MKIKKLDSKHYAIRFEIGDEIMTSLKKIMIANQWGFIKFEGIGAVKQTTFGYYAIEADQYVWTTIPEALELTSACGSVAWNATEPTTPLVHCHITVSNEQYQVFGGHLESATIAFTGEFFVTVLSRQKIFRNKNSETTTLWEI